MRLENSCAEADAALNKLRMGDPAVNMVLECVAVTALVALNKRFLMMEAASASKHHTKLYLHILSPESAN